MYFSTYNKAHRNVGECLEWSIVSGMMKHINLNLLLNLEAQREGIQREFMLQACEMLKYETMYNVNYCTSPSHAF